MNEDAEARPATVKRWRRLQLGIGLTLTLVSLVFLVHYAVEHHAEIKLARFGLRWAAGAVVIYAAALVATALGWVLAVRVFGSRLPWRSIAATSLISQIGKYAPGNVAQHIGRLALSQSQGMALLTATKATALELPSAVAAGVVVSTLAAIARPTALSDVSAYVAHLVPVGFILGFLTAGVAAFVFWAILRRRRLGGAPVSIRSAGAMFAIHCLSASLAGFSFYAMARAVMGPSINAVDAVFAFVVAWLAGFVTPGAPAGLGVRETVLVLGLPQLGPAALGVAIGHRVVTAIADALMALTGIVILRGARLILPPQRGDHDRVMR